MVSCLAAMAVPSRPRSSSAAVLILRRGLWGRSRVGNAGLVEGVQGCADSPVRAEGGQECAAPGWFDPAAGGAEHCHDRTGRLVGVQPRRSTGHKACQVM